MKKHGFCILLLSVTFLLAGCDEAKVYTYSDFLGEWTLPNVPQLSIMEDSTDPTQKMLDIKWEEGTVEYFATVGGTASGNVFTGSYEYSSTADNGSGALIYYSGDDLTEPAKSITITLTMHQNKPKVTCTGEGPLAGKVFSK